MITASAERTGTNEFVVEGKMYAGYLPASASYTLTVNKATPTVTAPVARSLTANGTQQALVEAGSATGGTLYYAMTTDETEPLEINSTSIPTATEAGT